MTERDVGRLALARAHFKESLQGHLWVGALGWAKDVMHGIGVTHMLLGALGLVPVFRFVLFVFFLFFFMTLRDEKP